MLEELSKNHRLWLKMLHKIGCPNHLAEDIVQEFYIKAYEQKDYHHKIIDCGKINTYYVYAMIRNMFISHLRLDKKYVHPYVDWQIADEISGLEPDELHLEMEVSYLEYLKDKIDLIVDGFTRHERQLYELHFIKGIPQRKISRDSKIGMSSINNTVRHIKKVFRQALYEDAQDFYNQDYNFKI